MKVWAYEVCFCKYETGYQVDKLFVTEEQAKAHMKKTEEIERAKYLDGRRVRLWEVECPVREERGSDE